MTIKKLRCIHHNGLQDQHRYQVPKDCGKVSPCSSEEDGKPGICPIASGGADNTTSKDDTGIPNVMLCFKTAVEKKEETKKAECCPDKKTDKYRKRAKSRELRAGILYIGCECERRNGLQDKCPRSECQGSPECMTLPPTCGPSEFANGKHIPKTLWKVQEQMKLEAKKLAEKNGTALGKTNKKAKDVHYDCFPINLDDSDECPICTKALHKHEQKFHEKQKSAMPTIFVGPINIGLPPMCQCCEEDEASAAC